jgi:uncharacterized protein (DUF1778 family)
MENKKAQLNIQIEPSLLVALKAEAIKSGKTLTAFVTERLVQANCDVKEDILEQRLLRLEEKVNLLDNFINHSSYKKNLVHSIFSDSGAKKYGEVARELFELHRKEKGLSFEDAWGELSRCLANYESQPELVYKLLVGKKVLYGLEMTLAYRHGSCGMRSALVEWTNSSLEPLNEAFLNAVELENLV